MKNKILTVFLALALVISSSGFSSATEKDIFIYIDGVRLVLNQKPIIENGQTLVPAEEFAKALGATAKCEDFWVSVTKGLLQERISFGFLTSIEINKVKEDISTGALKIDEICYVPIRAVAEGLFTTVEWKDGSIYITTNKDGYPEYPGVPDFGKLYNCPEKSITIDEVETKKPIGTLNGKTITVVSHLSSFIHTYNNINANNSNVEKYKEMLISNGYYLYTTREENGIMAEFYKSQDGSMVSVTATKNRVCLIGIIVPVSLESLGLEATQ